MNAVIYARFSSDRQREESIEGQLRECRAYAERKGISITGEYIDRAKSASKDTAKREEFLRMVKDSAKRQFDAVLVWKLDRFARNRYDSAHYKNTLRKNGVKVISATEAIAEGPEGIILESMLEGKAEYYSAELSEKVKRGHTENALKNQTNGGTTPFGYNVDDHKLAVDPVTAPVVLEIYQRYADGETIREILEDLNRKGIRTRKGMKFQYSSFTTMLQNRVYIGEYVYGKRHKENGEFVKNENPIVIPDSVPAIVPKELFDRVQARRAKNKHAPGTANAKKERYLLTTKLFCGKCGALMVGESGKSKTGAVHHYYKCGKAKREKTCDRKAVRKDWIENIVVKYTMLMLMNDTLMERLTVRLVEIQGEESREIKLMRQRLAEVENGIENLLNAIMSGVNSVSIKNKLNALEAEQAQLEASISKEEAEHPILTKEQISFFLHRYRETNTNDRIERQRLIDCFVNSVYLYEDKMVLIFNYKDGAKTITFDELNGSELCGSGSPEKPPMQKHRRFFVMFALSNRLFEIPLPFHKISCCFLIGNSVY